MFIRGFSSRQILADSVSRRNKQMKWIADSMLIDVNDAYIDSLFSELRMF